MFQGNSSSMPSMGGRVVGDGCEQIPQIGFGIEGWVARLFDAGGICGCPALAIFARAGTMLPTAREFDLENLKIRENPGQTEVARIVNTRARGGAGRIQKAGPVGATNYLYDGDNIVQEVNVGGAAVARYAQGQNIDEPLAEARSGETSYDQVDGLGSVTSLSNTSATIADTYVYVGFGNLSASSGSIGNAFRYTGRESDSETSLYYYRARYYDPQTGRFINEDPIRFAGGNNFYGYVWNDPVNHTDPSGLCPPAPKPPFIAYPPVKPCDTSGSRDHGYPAEDIRTGQQYGVPIYATEDGIIGNEFSGGHNSPYPGPPAPSNSTDYVIVRAWSGNYIKYVHVTPALPPGSIVHAGDIIGYNDNTGRQSGPHVHMEINNNGHKIDPSTYLQFSCSASN